MADFIKLVEKFFLIITHFDSKWMLSVLGFMTSSLIANINITFLKPQDFNW